MSVTVNIDDKLMSVTMDINKIPKELLPVTVTELAENMRKIKPNKRPRKLSNIYPIHSQTYKNIRDKIGFTATPSGRSSSQPFLPPNNKLMTVNSSKGKTATTATKMDMFVPSPGLNGPFAASPHSSIYEQERSDLVHFCGGSVLSNPSVDSVISDDFCGLDDHLEDSPLENLLTQEVINSLQSGSLNVSSDFTWGGKLDNDDPLPAVVENFGSNPTLAQLNMEPDISFTNMINLDQEDSKLNYPNLESVCSDMNSFDNQSNFITVSAGSVGLLAANAVDAKSHLQIIPVVESLESSYIRHINPIKSNFPPRTSQPQLIGVVPPVKKHEPEDALNLLEKKDDSLGKLKVQSPNLHKLLSKQSATAVKTETGNTSESLTGNLSSANTFNDATVQIVPSGGTKRIHTGSVKMEPLSPKNNQKPKGNEESTEEKWNDIKHFLHSPGQEPSAKKRRRYDSGSSGHKSDDEDEDDDDVSSYGGKDDDSDDDYSDIDADLAHISPSNCESLVAMGKKQKQYFWQYNVQSKGPKGTRLKLAVGSPSDPHVLNDFEDPVFDECNTAIAGIRHGGKARKGDGNEITPNPRKLFMIGHQLMRLNRQINACQLGAEVPAPKRNESRKEKNKLASRACRLKKKAQHEAHKIKLYGLEQEHSQLNAVLQFIWPHIRNRAKISLGKADKSADLSSSASLTNLLEAKISDHLKSMIAGHTTDYVNSVILKVESGDNSGGLNIKKSHKT